ncbi:MAG: ribosome assembly factor SBDS [Candidatus Methanofastidiosia archaeon]
MVSIDEAVIARLKRHGERFEILVSPKAAELKIENLNISELLASEFIFKDARTSQKASAEVLKKVFGIEDPEKIAKIILEEGEIHLTTEQRKKLLEEKKKKIVALIARDAIDPRTKTPHPPSRIENAMKQAKISIDLREDPEKQIPEILKEIRVILPIHFEKLRVAVKLPPEYTSNYYRLKEYGKILKEEWQGDGSYIALVEIPAGIRDEFYAALNSITKGSVEVKILER